MEQQAQRRILPERVYVTRDARRDALTKRVLSRLPKGIKVIELESRHDPLGADVETSSDATRFAQGKRALLLTRHQGRFLEACPGTLHHVCCNLWTVNPGEGCPMDCTYCFLQSYLRGNPTSKMFTNIDDMLDEIEQRAALEPQRLFRVCTGELMDSLVWDNLTGLTKELVPFFARIPNILLELKSKFSFVENLLDLRNEHRGKTVVSWSVNARTVTERDEALTSSLEERIDAAEKVIHAGYRVGFHFDPLILFDNWEDGYRDVIRYIFSRISADNVAWVSIATLRYKREMQKMMLERFPASKIPFGEQIVAKDNKLRYAQPLRLKLVNFVWKELKAVNSKLPVYMCMESAAAWRYIAGGPPTAGSELVEVFSRQGRLPIVAETPVLEPFG